MYRNIDDKYWRDSRSRPLWTNIAEAVQVYFSPLSKVIGAKRNRIESRIASRRATYGALGARCVDKAICLLLPSSRTRARCSLSCWKTEESSRWKGGKEYARGVARGTSFRVTHPAHPFPSPPVYRARNRRRRLYDIPKNTVAGVTLVYLVW